GPGGRVPRLRQSRRGQVRRHRVPHGPYGRADDQRRAGVDRVHDRARRRSGRPLLRRRSRARPRRGPRGQAVDLLPGRLRPLRRVARAAGLFGQGRLAPASKGYRVATFRGHHGSRGGKVDELEGLHGTELLSTGHVDVATSRERARLGRVRRVAVVLWVVAGWMALRLAWGAPVFPHLPIPAQLVPSFLIVFLLGAVLVLPMVAAGRSPHVLYRPSDIEVGLDDVVGCDTVREEVVRTLNLFLAHRTIRERMGATPRRGILFEGPPGTGKTHMAKAMAREAGVPFLVVSSSAFQSMYYGQTNRKIRAYFRAL